MALDPQYLDAIKTFEGYSPQAAWDYKQSSSGYGTRAQPGDDNIPQDQLKAVHEQRFQAEIGKAAASVDAFAPNLPQGIRAALTSLTYNAGPGWQQSGLGQAIKSGDFDAAKGIFSQYNKAGGAVNPGLVARREKELAWWGGQPQAAPATPAAAPSAPLQITPQPIFPNQNPGLQTTQNPLPQPSAPQFSGSSPPGTGLGVPFAGEGNLPPYTPQKIPFPQQRQVDLSRLRAQLKAPIFRRG